MHGVEGDVVDGVDERLVFGVGLAVSAVAFEGEVVAGERVSMWVQGMMARARRTQSLFLRRICELVSMRVGINGREYAHWIATRPSMEPTAKPLFADWVKHDTTRVCHFSGDCID